MALKINTNSCTSCGACEFECPNGAISMKGDAYVIKAALCSECDGESPQKCVAVCPADACVPV
ncbi:4Fe-4S binding protein [Pararhodospirillum photometricum]|uniref:4Fe-4S ferredoxin, iron-sulfur binding n=1 Tax=Pararhodospirillum photometricum DSM 122 TaxID=1150469 RepID=H6SN64_PARPM|nr:4Fe-4S binding protein [Pararhodospirillum photometricum]CCG06940.1 4Fe-4S ferredoxin, iron-sulfur binding [Pararhodospirillum photometricum DSM 122]